MTNNLEKNKSLAVDEKNIAQSNNDIEPSHSQMDVSDVGLEQDLINRLVSEYKGREELCDRLFEKKKVVSLKDDVDKEEFCFYLHDCDLFAGVEINNKKSKMSSFGTRVQGGHQFL
ncbi:14106_t:CDS:2 [Cetraspora pellucida]|uniref:14106_t:CDS:1 n=1 Tax=Cetraspora pellucida TaxID=1433469 RepID=A0A9N9BA70_9GLOM|nr:14106_t:CDS:2 [Cetraspora pellucida]